MNNRRLLFSAPRAHYGGEEKTIEVLRRLDPVGRRYECIGRLLWKRWRGTWDYLRLDDRTGWTPDPDIRALELREAKRRLHERDGDGGKGVR